MSTVIDVKLAATPSSKALKVLAASYEKQIPVPDGIVPFLTDSGEFPITVNATGSAAFEGSAYVASIVVTDDLSALDIPGELKDSIVLFDVSKYAGGFIGSIVGGIFKKVFPVESESLSLNISLLSVDVPVGGVATEASAPAEPF